MSSALPFPETAPGCAVHPHLDAVFACSRCGSFGCAECRGHDEATHCGPCLRRLSQDPEAMSPTRLLRDTLALAHQHGRWVLGLGLAVALIRLGSAGFLLLPDPSLAVGLSVVTNLGAQVGLSIYLMQRVATALRAPGQAQPGLAAVLGMVVPRILLMVLTFALSALVVGTGLSLLLIPGLYLALSTSLAPAIVAVEGRGPLAALRLSYELVKGYRLRLLGTLLPLGGSVLLAVLVLSNLLDWVISSLPSPIPVAFGIAVTTATMSAVSVYELGLVLAYQRLMERQPARRRPRP